MSTVDNYRWDDRSLYFNVTWFELRNISTVNRNELNYVALHRDEVLDKWELENLPSVSFPEAAASC